MKSRGKYLNVQYFLVKGCGIFFYCMESWFSITPLDSGLSNDFATTIPTFTIHIYWTAVIVYTTTYDFLALAPLSFQHYRESKDSREKLVMRMCVHEIHYVYIYIYIRRDMYMVEWKMGGESRACRTRTE